MGHVRSKIARTRPNRRCERKRQYYGNARREIAPKLDTLRTERRALKRYQKASTELERLACVPFASEWTDHRAKIAEREHQVEWELREKERATCETGAAEKNRADMQTECDRELKKGEKILRMEGEAKELEKVVIKLRRAQPEIR